MNADSFYYGEQLDTYGKIGRQSYHAYLGISMCILATVTNVCNIVIFTRKGMVSSTNIILTALAATDMFVALTFIHVTYICFIQNPSYLKDKFSYYQAYVVLVCQLSFMLCHYVSLWLAVMLAAWRFIAIASPLSARRLLSVNRTRFVVVAIYFITICINIPLVLLKTVKEVEMGNVTVYDIVHSELLQKENDSARVTYWVTNLVMKIVPCILLIRFTIALIVILRKAKAHRRNLATNVENDTGGRSINKMLLAILLLFLFSELPEVTILLLDHVFKYTFENNVFNIVVITADLLCLINHTFNFVVYYIMIGKYKETLKSIFKFRNAERANSVIALISTS